MAVTPFRLKPKIRGKFSSVLSYSFSIGPALLYAMVVLGYRYASFCTVRHFYLSLADKNATQKK